MVNDVKILLVDDHRLVRDSLGERLEREPGLTVVARSASADEAVRKSVELQPDVVLMDIDMPGLICFDAVRKIHAIRPEVKVIFLSAFVQDRYIEQALEVRANGYLSKGEAPEAVVAAVREVAAGGAYFSPEVSSRIVVDARGARLVRESKSRASTLTGREAEILHYIARGLSKKEIAKTMGISVKTVDRHTTNLMTKLDIHDRVELTRFAIREGLAEA